MGDYAHLTKDEKIALAKQLEKEIEEHRKKHYYYKNYEQAKKLILNQEYGAIANQHYLMFNNNVAGSVTFCGRELIQKMGLYNKKYWFKIWHKDTILHNKLYITNVREISDEKDVNIYMDTDSLFVSYDGAIKNCDWLNQVFNNNFVNKCDNNFMILLKEGDKLPFKINNEYFKGFLYTSDLNDIDILSKKIEDNKTYTLLIDGFFLKNRVLDKYSKNNKSLDVICNFDNELDFIHAIDKYRIANYFTQCLEKHAADFGVANVQDFELEKIADSVINIEKKRYIMNLVWEDGVYFDALKNIQTKGFDIVRSSTPSFARGGKEKKDGIMKVILYLFSHPDTFNIKELLKIVKDLRREMEILPIDDVCAQSSCSNYLQKVINDKTSVDVVVGTHFAVKAAAYHNYILHNNSEYETKYSYIKSGDKVKYYYCKGEFGLEVFAYKRGSFPIEIAPAVDYDESFYRFVLSPINTLVNTLKLPEINRRLSIVFDLFNGI